MLKMTALIVLPRRNRLASFTLVELLTVIAIIAILAALTLGAGSMLMNKAARSRASSEVAAMGTALESYKTDNGIYPSTGGLLTNTYAASDGSGIAYQTNAELIYQALSGQTNYQDTPTAGIKPYMSFKINQLGLSAAPAGTTTPGQTTYVKDPWGYAYGYSTGSVVGATTNAPYNGYGFYDLWSTGGVTLVKVTANSSLTNTWISNWQ